MVGFIDKQSWEIVSTESNKSPVWRTYAVHVLLNKKLFHSLCSLFLSKFSPLIVTLHESLYSRYAYVHLVH